MPRTIWLGVVGALPRNTVRAARRHACTAPKRVSRFSRAVVPESIKHLRHELEHASRALEAIERRPVFIKTVEHLRVDRIRLYETLNIAAFLRLVRHIDTVGDVEIGVGATHCCSGLGIGNG